MPPLRFHSVTIQVLAVLLLLPQAVASQVPQKLNYQVMLTDDADEPLAEQEVELDFLIYDAATDGTLLWSETHNTSTNSIGVAVVMLGETVPLDFGFEGPTWLEVHVDGEPLAPRRELVAAPYALRAAVADSLAGAMAGDGDWVVDGDDMYSTAPGFVGVGTTTPVRKLHVDNGNTDDGIRIAYGSDYPSLLADLRHGGSQGFIINSYAGGGSWADIRLQTNSTTRMFIDHAGRVGIGTESPVEKLDVVGTIRTEGFKMAGGATPGFVLTADADGVGTWQAGGAGGADADWSVAGRHMYSAVPGSLGVGTSTQRARLNVDGGNGDAIYCEVTDGAALYSRHLGGGGGGYVSTNDYGLYGLHADGVAIYGQSDTLAVLGYNQYRNQTGALGGEEWGVYGAHTGGAEGYLGAGTSPGNVGAMGTHPAGNFGYLGHENFGVYGENDASGNYGGLGSGGAGVWGESTDNYGVYALSWNGTGVHALTFDGVAVQGSRGTHYGYLGGADYGVKGEGTSKGVYGFSSSGYGVYGASESGRAGMFDGDVEVMTGSRIITPIIEITGGSDFSERFPVRGVAGGAATPGALVCVDDAVPGGLVVSSDAYDRRVAGVISGAGGISPGMLMGQEGSPADGETAVALSGRVYCLCDASSGPIGIGDLLTTSPTPGHAMSAREPDRAHGCVIGKAMTALEEGRGLVLVLVNLQ